MQHIHREELSAYEIDFLDKIRDGQIFLKGDPGYEERRLNHNGNCLSRKPHLIVRPETKEAVSDAVVLAHKHGLEISVRSGGHGFICQV